MQGLIKRDLLDQISQKIHSLATSNRNFEERIKLLEEEQQKNRNQALKEEQQRRDKRHQVSTLIRHHAVQCSAEHTSCLAHHRYSFLSTAVHQWSRCICSLCCCHHGLCSAFFPCTSVSGRHWPHWHRCAAGAREALQAAEARRHRLQRHSRWSAPMLSVRRWPGAARLCATGQGRGGQRLLLLLPRCG